MRITYFRSLFDTEAAEHDVSWPDLVASMAAPHVFAAKADCPLIKLARFGSNRNPKGFLRNNHNVTAISGIELDYDGEQVPLRDAASRFATLGIEALLFTSASHDTARPRWRVLLPLSGEYAPEFREAFVEAANAALGGICAPESSTLSQAFYVGQVTSSPYDCVHVPGEPLDRKITPQSRPISAAASIDVPEWEKVDLSTLPIDNETRLLIQTPPAKGARSEVLMTVANTLARAQVPAETILRVLADPDNPISSKALERRTVSEAMDWLARFTVAKALKRFPPLSSIFPPLTGRPVDRKQLLHDATALRSEPNPTKWVIRGILEQECFAVLFGASESGKSLIALDMAQCIASGHPFHDRDTTPGPVVYISGEGNNGLSRRLRAWQVANAGVEFPANMLLLTSRAVAFRDADNMRELIAAIDAMPKKPFVIFIDTYARANAGGNENDAKDAAEFVKICDNMKERYGCTVVLIGHTSKASPDKLMGSTVIRNAADVEMSFARLEQDEPKNVSMLKCTKMKDAENFGELYFQLQPQKLGWFDPETKEQLVSWTFKELDAPDALPKTPTRLLFAQCLGGKPIAYEKVRTAFMALRTGSKGSKQKAWDRALDYAKEREWCTHVNDMLHPSPVALYRDGIDITKEVAQG